jgi:threonine dehydrogenase-like Zn-dependent dehydrogenase
MKTKGTYLQNSAEQPIVYGDVEIFNIPRRRLRGEEEKEGLLCKTVLTGFCGTDFELMHMGQRGELGRKFPTGTNRLINGHEGVVYVPEQDRYAIVLIRGGNSFDPTRFMDDETYFEYGCDGADGLMSEENYYHPDMLLEIPKEYLTGDKLPLSLAKKLTFSDPYACMIFQLERMEDLGSAQNFRLEMAINKCSEEESRKRAKNNIFKRVVIFGLGTTGMFIGDLIRQSYPQADIVFVARSSKSSPKVSFAVNKAVAKYIQNSFNNDKELAEAIEDELGGKATLFIGTSGNTIEHKIAFEEGLLGNNGIYNSFSLGPTVNFKTMPFGFKNHLIFGSINFRQDHMEKAIRMLCNSNYDEIVECIDLEDIKADPKGVYESKIYSKESPLKTATIWNDRYIDRLK